MLHVELKQLLRAYKASSDISKRTGESATKAPFDEEIEDIFGTKPEIRKSHTINLSGDVIKALPMSTNASQNVHHQSHHQPHLPLTVLKVHHVEEGLEIERLLGKTS